MIRAANIHYEIAERTVGTPYGGIGLIHQLASVCPEFFFVADFSG
jgi:hypothetical protein